MLPKGLQELLILQDRDSRRLQFEKILAQIPRERVSIDSRIVAHRAGIEAAKQAVTTLELKRKELEATLRDLEDQILRYRNQQLQVKKNDEYQALTHEIELTEGKIGDTEGAEIQILYDLDAERERARETTKRLETEIAGEEAQLKRIAERETQVGGDIQGAVAEVEKARAEVSESLVRRYDQLAKTLGLPVVVPLVAQKCGGCHLRVSGGVDTEARKGNEIVSCDNCTRIIYVE
jgi:predicted  nucleic acid-binding Zn-ribbon protein